MVGIDSDTKKIEKLKAGYPTMYEQQLDHFLKSTLAARSISFQNEVSDSESDVYMICVGTPIDNNTRKPKLDNIKNATMEVSKALKKNDHVIIRSTVPVGTGRNIIKKILESESGLKTPEDFLLASAPERTLQGLALHELRQLPQIVAGIDQYSLEKTASIFNSITKTVVRVSSLEAAELIKLLDNTYRDITISIGNLCGKICHKLNLDSREVIEAANFGYSRNKILFPGAGVGGGCLVKDPYLLIESVGKDVDLNLIKTCRMINDSMTDDMNKLIKIGFEKLSRKIEGSKILVLGFAFKGYPETDDIRYSPSLLIVEFLKKAGAKLYGYDTVVPATSIQNLGVEYVSDLYGKNYDCIVIMNNNPKFKNLDFKKFKKESNQSLLVIDGWYLYNSKSLKSLGIEYFALGSKV